MPKRSRTPARRQPEDPTDPILNAAAIFRQVSGEGPTEAPPVREKNPHAVAMGKLGGPKGGKARAAKLSARRRSEIAKKAARVRWGGKPG